jgi:hypothetical protein
VVLNPFSIFSSKPIHCPPVRQVNYERSYKDYEESTSRDSP